MTAEAIEDIWSRTRGRDWTWADLQQIPADGHRYEIIEAGVPAYWRVELEGVGTPSVTVYELAGVAYREVTTVAAGSVAVVATPFRVELRPAELAGPRRRA